jgi:hypothetical protein
VPTCISFALSDPLTVTGRERERERERERVDLLDLLQEKGALITPYLQVGRQVATCLDYVFALNIIPFFILFYFFKIYIKFINSIKN